MNKRQKILTIVALAAFAAIIAVHYGSVYFGDYPHTEIRQWHYYTDFRGPQRAEPVISEHHWERPELRSTPAIDDVRMPLFVLSVFYTGLFFLMATPKGNQ
jgi:hypothetical protein